MKAGCTPCFFRFSFQFLSLKGILYIHDTDAFFIPGRGGVDLGHVKAGGAIQAVVAEVKERGFSDTGLFAGGDVFPGQAHLRIGASLDLHEAEDALIPGDQVDLAEAAAVAVCRQIIPFFPELVGHPSLAPNTF